MNYTMTYYIFHLDDEVLLNKPRSFVVCFLKMFVLL